MKKTKKLAALFLALMMALSCMAMPAMAAGEDEDDEGIMPLGPLTMCSYCKTMQEIIEEGPWFEMENTHARCSSHPWIDHVHSYEVKYVVLDCGHANEVRRSDVCHWGE